MASSGQSITISYVAWNTSTNAGQTGDAANHTLRWVKDGTSAAPTNAAAEVDNVNAPGVYKLTLTTAEATCNSGILCGKSSTANVAIMPISITFEQLPTAAPGANTGLPVVGTQVPNATAGASGGLPTLNSALNVAADLQTIKTQTVTCAAGVTILANVGTATHALVVDASGFVTVATNNDKTGYSLSVTPPTSAQIATAVWTDLLASSDFSTASSIGALLKTDIDAAVSSRMATFTLPTNFSALGIGATGHITTVDTCVTNSDMRGTDNAAPAATALSNVQWTNALATSLTTLAGHDPGATLATGAEIAALNNLSATQVWTLANGIETGVTPQQALQRIGATTAGKLSGSQTATEVFVGLDGVTTRVTVTADPSGNRTAIVYA